MTFTFTPDETAAPYEVPDLEDARADFAPFYTTEKTIAQAQSEVSLEMTKLGGILTHFTPGIFQVDGRKRYGYLIHFIFDNKRGVLRLAGLPMRTETPKKTQQARTQALLNLGMWLKALVTQRIFMATPHPLFFHLLVNDDQTVGDYVTTVLASMLHLDGQHEPQPYLLQGEVVFSEGES